MLNQPCPFRPTELRAASIRWMPVRDIWFLLRSSVVPSIRPGCILSDFFVLSKSLQKFFCQRYHNRQIQHGRICMLTTLRIKNLALVADLTLELQPGYNAVTGETGAGKSILIGALNLVLGERADRTLIRGGANSCSVEAVFDVSRLRAPLKKFLEENGPEPCDGDQLLLKRSFSANGTNRQFINGSPTTLNVLAALGEWLVDIHGPHDHQSLLHPSKQLDILDAFGGLDPLRGNFSELVQRRAALEAEKTALVVDEKTYQQQLDLLRHQVNEIAAAKLQPGEETELEREHRLASNVAKLLELSQTALRQLTDDEGSVTAQSGALGRTLQELKRIDPEAGCLLSLHEEAMSFLRDLQSDLSHYADKLDINPARLQQLEERLNVIQSLKQKYGATLDDVINFGEEARQKLEQLERRDADLARINAELKEVDEELKRVGEELSAQRRKIIPKLSKAVARQLADIGFKQSSFDISVKTAFASDDQPSRGSSSGFDTIEFQFTPNPGEPTRPLRAIASSGEMARVMLALKTVLAAQDDVPVLVFDEVDANVGGETANAVGEKMRQLGEQRQVLCITHLAPVAAEAAAHYVVTKETKLLRTITNIRLLEKNERVTELARMLGGQTDAARKLAESLLRH
ncbi:MAG TPA: DNA repair protein RecN [Candidatus Eisenbacteria bacterium]|nr:DNA repair protein RecN [Candidatus Eisenbacteria bacterium]